MAGKPSCELRNASVIASAFERGCHFSAKEEAVFAPMARGLQATKTSAIINRKILSGYSAIQSKASEVSLSDVTVGPIIMGGQTVWSEIGEEFKDCLPCIGRLQAAWSLQPAEDLLNLLWEDIQGRLAWLKRIADILGNQGIDLDVDLCDLLHFLNGMCIVDLQAILYLLSALNMDLALSLEGLMPMLKNLIAPLIAPPAVNINVLLDQLIKIILIPLDCIIEALDILIRDMDVATATSTVLMQRYRAVQNATENWQRAREEQREEREVELRNLERERRASRLYQSTNDNSLSAIEQHLLAGGRLVQEDSLEYRRQLTQAGRADILTPGAAVIEPVTGRGLAQEIYEVSQAKKTQEQIQGNALTRMQQELITSRSKLEQRLLFWREIINELIGQWKVLDYEYMNFSINKLINLRLIALIVAIIKAKAQGKDLCDQGENPDNHQVATWFDSFLNPNSALLFAIDNDGNITIREKTPVVKFIGETQPLPNRPTLITLEEDPLLDRLLTPIETKAPCRLRTSKEEVDQVNQWIAELNEAD